MKMSSRRLQRALNRAIRKPKFDHKEKASNARSVRLNSRLKKAAPTPNKNPAEAGSEIGRARLLFCLLAAENPAKRSEGCNQQHWGARFRDAVHFKLKSIYGRGDITILYPHRVLPCTQRHGEAGCACCSCHSRQNVDVDVSGRNEFIT